MHPQNTWTSETGVVHEAPHSRGCLSFLPSSWIAYAELMRLHKPAGILYIYFPYLFGSLFALIIKSPAQEHHLYGNATNSALLLLIAILLRSVGCTWNDIVDRDLDRYVARCRVRPLARGAITPKAAYTFTAVQYLVILAVVVPFAQESLLYLGPVVVTGTVYPYAKRFTNYAQVILGLSLCLGTLIGCAVMGVRPLALGASKQGLALGTLSASYVVWTAIYDTIYAFQDIRDDKKAGVKAMSVWHERHMKRLLYSLAAVQIALVIATGLLIDVGWGYLPGLLGTVVSLLTMVRQVDLECPETCGWWFQHGALLVGGSLTLSLLGEYAHRTCV